MEKYLQTKKHAKGKRLSHKSRLTNKKKRINSPFHGLNPISITLICKQTERNIKYFCKDLTWRNKPITLKNCPTLAKKFIQLRNILGSQEALKLYFIDYFELAYPQKLKTSKKTSVCWNQYNSYCQEATIKNPNIIIEQKQILREILQKIPINSQEDMQTLIHFNCKKMEINQEKIELLVKRTILLIKKLLSNEFQMPKIAKYSRKAQEIIEVESSVGRVDEDQSQFNQDPSDEQQVSQNQAIVSNVRKDSLSLLEDLVSNGTKQNVDMQIGSIEMKQSSKTQGIFSYQSDVQFNLFESTRKIENDIKPILFYFIFYFCLSLNSISIAFLLIIDFFCNIFLKVESISSFHLIDFADKLFKFIYFVLVDYNLRIKKSSHINNKVKHSKINSIIRQQVPMPFINTDFNKQFNPAFFNYLLFQKNNLNLIYSQIVYCFTKIFYKNILNQFMKKKLATKRQSRAKTCAHNSMLCFKRKRVNSLLHGLNLISTIEDKQTVRKKPKSQSYVDAFDKQQVKYSQTNQNENSPSSLGFSFFSAAIQTQKKLIELEEMKKLSQNQGIFSHQSDCQNNLKEAVYDSINILSPSYLIENMAQDAYCNIENVSWENDFEWNPAHNIQSDNMVPPSILPTLNEQFLDI